MLDVNSCESINKCSPFTLINFIRSAGRKRLQLQNLHQQPRLQQLWLHPGLQKQLPQQTTAVREERPHQTRSYHAARSLK